MPPRRYFPRPRWTPGQERAFSKAHLAGKEEAVSAQRLGRTVNAVKAKRDRMKLPKAPLDLRQAALPGLGAGAAPSITTATDDTKTREDADDASTRNSQRAPRGTPGAGTPLSARRQHGADSGGQRLDADGLRHRRVLEFRVLADGRRALGCRGAASGRFAVTI